MSATNTFSCACPAGIPTSARTEWWPSSPSLPGTSGNKTGEGLETRETALSCVDYHCFSGYSIFCSKAGSLWRACVFFEALEWGRPGQAPA